MNFQSWIVLFAIISVSTATLSGGSSGVSGGSDLPCTQIFTSGPASKWIPAIALKKESKTCCVAPTVVPKTCTSHYSPCHHPATGYVHPSHYCAHPACVKAPTHYCAKAPTHYCAKAPTHYCAKAPTRYCAKVPNHYYGLGCGYHHCRPVNNYRGCYSYPRQGCYQAPRYGCYAPQTC